MIDAIREHLLAHDPGAIAGLYLVGSAATSGLRPESDIDLLMVTNHSLSTRERAELTRLLLSISGWRGHATAFPEVSNRRPIELTSLVVADLEPLTNAPRRDFQYGEWLRGDLMAGHLPLPAADPDVITLLATARAGNVVLLGSPRVDLIPQIADDLLQRALLAAIPDLLANLPGDERNVLLTLARILVTLDTGTIVSKDDAATTIAPALAEGDRVLLLQARDAYLGLATDNLAAQGSRVNSLAQKLADHATSRPT